MMISPTAISPHKKRGGINWSSYWKAIYAAMTNKPTTAYSTAADTFIKALDSGGVWAKLDRLFVFASETNDGGEALLDWIHPTGTPAILGFGAGGSNPTFTSNIGFRGSKTNLSYINTQYNPSTNGDQFKQNSASIGCYVNSVDILSETNIIMGTTPGKTYISPYANKGYNRQSVNSSFDIDDSGKDGTKGLYSVVRPNATTVIKYKDGAVDKSTSVASAAIDNKNLYIFCTSALNDFDGSQVSMAYAGGGLTADDIILLNDAWSGFFLSL